MKDKGFILLVILSSIILLIYGFIANSQIVYLENKIMNKDSELLEYKYRIKELEKQLIDREKI